ncbi:MAG: thioredoxin family protein [Synergistaceae bacterium]|nr:thioredoxin family protein [Synergistaceae bacterium]
MFELLAENFDEFKEKEYALIDFWQATCPECLALKPQLEELESDFPAVSFYAIDCQKVRKLAISLKVFGLPSVLIFSRGTLLYRFQKEDCTIDNIRHALNEKN